MPRPVRSTRITDAKFSCITTPNTVLSPQRRSGKTIGKISKIKKRITRKFTRSTTLHRRSRQSRMHFSRLHAHLFHPTMTQLKAFWVIRTKCLIGRSSDRSSSRSRVSTSSSTRTVETEAMTRKIYHVIVAPTRWRRVMRPRTIRKTAPIGNQTTALIARMTIPWWTTTFARNAAKNTARVSWRSAVAWTLNLKSTRLPFQAQTSPVIVKHTDRSKTKKPVAVPFVIKCTSQCQRFPCMSGRTTRTVSVRTVGNLFRDRGCFKATSERTQVCHCQDSPTRIDFHVWYLGEKPFKCNFVGCLKAFADKSNLRAHVQTHSNTKVNSPAFFKLPTNLDPHFSLTHARNAVKGSLSKVISTNTRKAPAWKANLIPRPSRSGLRNCEKRGASARKVSTRKPSKVL